MTHKISEKNVQALRDAAERFRNAADGGDGDEEYDAASALATLVESLFGTAEA